MNPTRIALLRGINVGRARRLAMADLRALLEGLGARRVRTLLNSGNAVFEAGADLTAAAIEAGLRLECGVAAPVLLLGADRLDAAMRALPWDAAALDPAHLLLGFAEPSALALAAPLSRRDWGGERFALGAQACYLDCPAGIADSPLARAVAGLGEGAFTCRNWNTLLKLQALALAPAEA